MNCLIDDRVLEDWKCFSCVGAGWGLIKLIRLNDSNWLTWSPRAGYSWTAAESAGFIPSKQTILFVIYFNTNLVLKHPIPIQDNTSWGTRVLKMLVFTPPKTLTYFVMFNSVLTWQQNRQLFISHSFCRSFKPWTDYKWLANLSQTNRLVLVTSSGWSVGGTKVQSSYPSSAVSLNFSPFL